MNNKLFSSIVAIFVVLCSVANAGLKVGDPAPGIGVSKWVQGVPLKEFEKGKVYVIEFWATWCGPCVAGIPHLEELHRKLNEKGVVFIGQNVCEEDTSAVEAFVRKMGKKMTYRVALDDTKDHEKGFMMEHWMEAAGQSGIPCAFVVDQQGVIVWIGHPGMLNEQMLGDVVDGRFDAKAAIEKAAQIAKQEEAIAARYDTLQDAADKKDWKTVEMMIGEIVKIKPDLESMLRFDMALGKHDAAEAVKQAMELTQTDDYKADAESLNETAWRLLTEIDQPDKSLIAASDSIIRKALELAPDDASALDTLARIQFLQGRTEDAVKTAEKALLKADDESREALKSNLESFKKGVLPKIDDDPGGE